MPHTWFELWLWVLWDQIPLLLRLTLIQCRDSINKLRLWLLHSNWRLWMISGLTCLAWVSGDTIALVWVVIMGLIIHLSLGWLSTDLQVRAFNHILWCLLIGGGDALCCDIGSCLHIIRIHWTLRRVNHNSRSMQSHWCAVVCDGFIISLHWTDRATLVSIEQTSSDLVYIGWVLLSFILREHRVIFVGFFLVWSLWGGEVLGG